MVSFPLPESAGHLCSQACHQLRGGQLPGSLLSPACTPSSSWRPSFAAPCKPVGSHGVIHWGHLRCMLLGRLPPDALDRIIGHLDVEAMRRLASTCRAPASLPRATRTHRACSDPCILAWYALEKLTVITEFTVANNFSQCRASSAGSSIPLNLQAATRFACQHYLMQTTDSGQCHQQVVSRLRAELMIDLILSEKLSVTSIVVTGDKTLGLVGPSNCLRGRSRRGEPPSPSSRTPGQWPRSCVHHCRSLVPCDAVGALWGAPAGGCDALGVAAGQGGMRAGAPRSGAHTTQVGLLPGCDAQPLGSPTCVWR